MKDLGLDRNEGDENKKAFETDQCCMLAMTYFVRRVEIWELAYICAANEGEESFAYSPFKRGYRRCD